MTRTRLWRLVVVACVVAPIAARLAAAQAETETETQPAPTAVPEAAPAAAPTGDATAPPAADATAPPAADDSPVPTDLPPVAKAPVKKWIPRKKLDLSKPLDKTEDKVAGGRHWRVTTDVGAIHVWIPPGYNRATAGTVVYVHGYRDSSDTAWKNYNLAKQFKASGQNAIFIVPEAPAGNGEEVKWPALTDLRKAITKANIKLPDGPTVIIGHSGGFRTMMQWVDHKVVKEVILLDAMYGGESAFDQFIDSGKHADQHKLIMIGSDTATESTAFIEKYPFAVARDKMPASAGDFKKREKSAKLLYIKSQYSHNEIVSSGKVIPILLRLTPLKHR